MGRAAFCLAALSGAGSAACSHPAFTHDGQMVFGAPGSGGATVITANGVEYHEGSEAPPVRNVSHDANDPWRAPIGFLLPRSGRFTQTSKPTVFGDRTNGVAGSPGNDPKAPSDEKVQITLRPSDTLVPSWGGEVLVRVDVIAPSEDGAARFGEDVILVVGNNDPKVPAQGELNETASLLETALGQLASRDRVSVIDAVTGRTLIPPIPASNRSLILAAVAQRMSARNAGPKQAVTTPTPLAKALSVIHANKDSSISTRAIMLADGHEPSGAADVQAELQRISDARIGFDVLASSPNVDKKGLELLTRAGGGNLLTDEDLATRAEGLRRVLPASGPLVYDDVVLTFEGTPAPSHVLEASGGDVRWRLEAGELDLGSIHAGEARTEIVRVTVPAWVPAERFAFTVSAHLTHDQLADGAPRDIKATLPCVYSDNITALSESRNGDVIAYASALAARKRLDAAFVGQGGARPDEALRKLAILHAQSLKALAEDTHDPALAEESETLAALVSASP